MLQVIVAFFFCYLSLYYHNEQDLLIPFYFIFFSDFLFFTISGSNRRFGFTSEIVFNMMSAANSLKVSCAGWISVKKEDNYFSLGPGERKDIDVTITVPNKLSDTLEAHSAVLYVSQMNPVDDVDSKGAKIKVSIRSGIKIFHKFPSAKAKKIEIQNLTFDKSKKQLNLFFENEGNVWTDGKVYTDFVNVENGKKVSIDAIVFYTMPGNKREINISLPEDLPKGKYTASVMIDYGDNNLELGELNFMYD